MNILINKQRAENKGIRIKDNLTDTGNLRSFPKITDYYTCGNKTNRDSFRLMFIQLVLIKPFAVQMRPIFY